MYISMLKTVCESDNAIASLVERERTYEVDSDRFTSGTGDGQGVKRTTELLCVVFILLAVDAGGYISTFNVTISFSNYF
jgi:hypothetical protein